MSNSLKWTVIGGGNGGQTTAGHLGSMGFDVTIYDIFEETIEAISRQGGIVLEGALSVFGKISLATTKIEQALEKADVIIVTVPATAHETVAKACSPYLKDGQIIVLNPAATFGSLAFLKTLKDNDCRANVTLAETNTLLYGCRIIEAGRTTVFGLKSRILLAAMPASETEKVVEIFQTAFPQFEGADSVLNTSLDNTNPILHTATTLLNTGTIESNRDWKFYVDGFTPSIGKFIEKMDGERIAIGKALGVKLPSCRQQLEIEYNVFEDTLADSVRKNPVYQDIKGQNTLDTRYLLEDIPMGLVPFVALGKLLELPTMHMETVIDLAQLLLERDLIKDGRTLENLGIENMNSETFKNYILTAEKLS